MIKTIVLSRRARIRRFRVNCFYRKLLPHTRRTYASKLLTVDYVREIAVYHYFRRFSRRAYVYKRMRSRKKKEKKTIEKKAFLAIFRGWIHVHVTHTGTKVSAKYRRRKRRLCAP